MNTVEQMKKFIEPKSVALLGVSRRTGEGAFNILESLLSYGYPGKLYPINPNATEILGVKTYSRIAEVQDKVDLAVINLPRHLVPGIVGECAAQGIDSVIIVTQGFADASDEEGNQLQKELDDFVKKGIRILGPNTFGTANPFLDFSSCFRRLDMVKKPVGLICQTGTFFIGSPEIVLLGKGFDVGNSCDVDASDCLEYFEQDEQVKVVALHIEGVRDGPKFLKAASRLVRKKPLLALKTGRSVMAAKAVQSHTGTLVGKDEVWEAAFAQAGVIRVSDIDELNDLVRAFTLLPPMRGRKIGVATSSGGMGIMVIDACQQYKLEVPEFSAATTERIRALSPPWLSINNPADLWPAVMVSQNHPDKVLGESLDAILKEIDGLVLIWVPWSRQNCDDFCQLLLRLAETYRKPIVMPFAGRFADEVKCQVEAAGGVMVGHNPARAVRVLGRMAQYSAFRGWLQDDAGINRH